MITSNLITIDDMEIVSSRHELHAKSLLIEKANKAGWPIEFSTSLDLKPKPGFRISCHRDDFAGVTKYKIEEIK